jgi:signal recognition particle subunit SRP54
LADQLGQMQKLGGMSSILGMLPGIGKMKKQIGSSGLDDSMFKQQAAIISSMTPQERRHPKILAASRKRRIAAGSGTSVQEINKLLKMHRQMADMMKSVSRGKGGLAKMFGMGGGMPEMTPEMLDAVKSGKMPGGMQMPPGMSGLPRAMPGLPGGMDGLPKGFPGGFGGLPGLPGKKK